MFPGEYDPLGYSADSAGRSFVPSLLPPVYALTGTLATYPAFCEPNAHEPICLTSERKVETVESCFASCHPLPVGVAVATAFVDEALTVVELARVVLEVLCELEAFALLLTFELDAFVLLLAFELVGFGVVAGELVGFAVLCAFGLITHALATFGLITQALSSRFSADLDCAGAASAKRDPASVSSREASRGAMRARF